MTKNIENPEDINLLLDESVSVLIESRHILHQDIQQVIHHGETTGEKLYQSGDKRFLAKLSTPNAVFYVEYSIEDDGYRVHTAYSHMSKIVGES